MFRSTDAGRTWERITAEEDTARRLLIKVDAVGDLYAADTHTMWRFAKATQTWETWTVPELFYPTILLANPQRPGWLYAANTGWAGYSTDGGRTWSRIENVTSGFWSLAIAPNGSDLLTLEQTLEWIEDDELVEVTPQSIRIRKMTLNHSQREVAAKKVKKAAAEG